MKNEPTPTEIKEARKGLKLSQQQMADLMGYGAKSRIYELESGRKSMSGPAVKWFRAVVGDTTVAAEINAAKKSNA